MIEYYKKSTLLIPSLRAHMGDWYYYISCLRMKDLADRVNTAAEIHKNKNLSDLIQRSLTDKSKDIRNYLLNQEQRLFNSLVIGVYGGNPNFIEIDIRDTYNHNYDSNKFEYGILGYLKFDGNEELFALDGQHRLTGIKKALEMNPELGDEEISAIFIGHSKDEAGIQRTRRLFTTLNRYAKAVNKSEIISLDEDDYCAVLTRKLIEEYEPFGTAINVKKGRNLPTSDRRSVTTIEILFDSINEYLKLFEPKWKHYRKYRPDQEILDKHYQRLVMLFDSMFKLIPSLEAYLNKPDFDKAIKFRNSTGGNLLFRPIGFISLIKTIAKMVNDNIDLYDAISRLNKIPMNLSDKPWVGVIWDSENNKMMTEGKQKMVEQILYFGVGGDLKAYWPRSSEQQLLRDLAGMSGKTVSEIILKRYR